MRVAARDLQVGDRVGSGEVVKWRGVGARTPRGKVEVHLDCDGRRRFAIWGASTQINVNREGSNESDL